MRNGTESLKKRNYEKRKDQWFSFWRVAMEPVADNRPRRINLSSHSSLRISVGARRKLFRRKHFIRISGKMEGTITHIAEP